MSSVIIFPTGAGGIAIIYPNWSERLSADETDDAILNRTRVQAVPSGVPYLIMPAATVPAERTHRDAWTADFTGAPVNP